MSLCEIADAPDAILEQLRLGRTRRARSKDTRESVVPEIDHPSAIERAIQYLKTHAPEAIEGAGGDSTTYLVACHVKDFGVSRNTCFDLIAEHWNEQGKASPPWNADDLLAKVDSAYKNGRNPIGVASALAEFDPVELDVEKMDDPLDQYDVQAIGHFTPDDIPRREWVVDHLLAKSYLTSLVAPPGAGKTTLEILIALAVVTGRPFLGFRVRQRGRVFLWNQEDDMDELQRRILAAMRHLDLTFDDLLLDGEPALIVGSGAEKPLTVVKRNDHGALSLTKTARTLPHYLKTRKIDVAMFDPMVELHQAEENNNVEMGYVARVFRSMAKGANCAVLLVHHTRKPPSGDSAAHVGNMDSSRGAGSVMGVSRMALTLYTIDQGEADRRGVSEEERHRYVRLDDAKNNLALSGGEPVFFRREGVNIRDFEEEPEEIGVLSWVQLEKRKSRRESAEDDLLDAVALVVGSVRGGRMPAVEVAERLIASDPIYSGASREGLSKAVKRVAVCDKATALGMTMQEATWPGRKRTMVISVCPESLESSMKSET